MSRIRSCLLLELVAVTAFVSVMVGCSGGGGSADMVPVSGKVTMSGGAVSGAQVTFSPVAAGGSVAVGNTNAQGEFTMIDGALPGDYNVFVSKSNVVATVGVTKSTADDPSEAYRAAEARGADLSGSGEAKAGSELAKAAPTDLLPVKYKTVDGGLKAKVEKGKDNTKFEFKLEP